VIRRSGRAIQQELFEKWLADATQKADLDLAVVGTADEAAGQRVRSLDMTMTIANTAQQQGASRGPDRPSSAGRLLFAGLCFLLG
jgi:hypothetical protein